MKRIPSSRLALLPGAALLMTFTACEAQKSSSPLSPSVAGPIAGVEITTPRMVEPGSGVRLKASQQPITLRVENAHSNGVRPLYYTFEVATDSEFQTKMYARSQVPPGEGSTSVVIDRLEVGRSYYWRARAEDGANSGGFAVAQFEILPQPMLGIPPLVSPINNERTSSRRPILVVGMSDRNVAVEQVYYGFQVALDPGFSQVVAAIDLPEAGPQTSFTVPTDLQANQQHYWRARAGNGEFATPWSGAQGFVTPAPVPAPPPPGPGPLPGGGGSCAGTHGPTIIECISAKYADYRRPVGSLSERQSNMMFLRDRIIEAGLCGGVQYGYNLKRGGPEHSIDVIAWKRSDGNMGVDIAFDYDNHGSWLQLYWGEVDLLASYDPYPPVSCGGV